MSPPIRDGSGDSIGSIRLGDGSEISEVRTGAGDVLFSGVPSSAILKYTYEDTANTTTVTDVYNNNDGTINGNPTYTATGADEGNALDLDGSGDFVETGVSADVSNSWSVATYIHADGLGQSDEFFVGGTQFGVLGVFNSSSEIGVFMQDDSGSNQAAQEAVSNVSDNTLYHLVGVYDASASELRYYRDGSRLDATDVSGSSFSTSNNWAVGIRGDRSREFDGRVDQTNIYSKALSDSEVSDLFNLGSI